MRRGIMKVGIAVAALVALAGCSVSVGSSPTVEKASLDKQVAASITPDEAGAEVTADCDGDLEGKVGAQQDCHVDVGEQKADVRLHVTSVKDDEVHWDTQPFLAPETIGDTIKGNLDGQGITVDTVDCQQELVGKVGETTTCTTTGAKAPGDLKVEVTSVDGLLINFHYESA